MRGYAVRVAACGTSSRFGRDTGPTWFAGDLWSNDRAKAQELADVLRSHGYFVRLSDPHGKLIAPTR